MNYPRLVLAALATLIVFFAWGFLTEGWLCVRISQFRRRSIEHRTCK